MRFAGNVIWFVLGGGVLALIWLLGAAVFAVSIIGFVFNIIWALTFGWVLFFTYIFAGIFNCLTIIGIPFGIQSFKLASISFWPVGRRVVTIEVARIARTNAAQKKMAQY